MFGPVETKDPYDSWIHVFNNGSSATDVRLTIVGGGNSRPAPAPIRLDPQRLSSIHVDQLAGDELVENSISLLIESDQAISVSRELKRIPGPTFSASFVASLR